MKEQLVSFETAKLAKEKGFNLPTKHQQAKFNSHDFSRVTSYSVLGEFKRPFQNNDAGIFKEDEIYSAPQQSLLQKWLRDNHGVRVFLSFDTIDDSEIAWVWNIVTDHEGKGRKKDVWDFYERYDSFSKSMWWHESYEEALEVGLQEALRLLPQSNNRQ